jgi:hypothetical protein
MLELAKQAGLKKEHASDREYIGDFDWREFGDLIVRECAALCDLYAMPDGTSETAIILASAIRRKFGVE